MTIVDSEVLSRCLFDESNDAFLIFEPESGQILEVNPVAQKLTGRRRQELLQLKVADILSGREPMHVKQLREATEETRFFHGRDGYLLKQASGRQLDVNVSVSRLHGEAGTLGLIVARDVTERKRGDDLRRAYQRVLEQLATGSRLEELLVSVVEMAEQQSVGMKCTVMLMDDDGQHLRHGVAPMMSEEFIREVDGLPVGPQHGSCGTAAYRGQRVITENIATDPLWVAARHVVDRYGFRACWSQPIISSSDRVLGTFAMYYADVRTPTDAEIRVIETAAHIAGIAIERSLREAEVVRQRAQLCQITKLTTIGELAAGVVHEVVQPTSAIVNFVAACQALLKRPEPPLAEIESHLQDVRSAAQRIGQITDRLRGFIRGSAPHRSTCQVRQVIGEVLNLLSGEVTRHHVRIETDFGDDDAWLFADRVQIHQLLVNLIVNACDAIAESGSEGGTIWIRCRATDEQVDIDIEDTGIGLPAHDAGRIFELFFTTKRQGTGIGLAICRTIVEAHGGKITATPSSHGGAAFHVRLPAAGAGSG